MACAQPDLPRMGLYLDAADWFGLRYGRAVTPLILRRLIALPYLILGGWCLILPRNVEHLPLNADYQHLSATSALLIGC